MSVETVTGAPLDAAVRQQLEARAAKQNVERARDGNDIIFMGNKNAWVKLSSFIRLIPGSVGANTYGAETSLAQKYVLSSELKTDQGGQRYGVAVDTGAYGAGGVDEVGYRPMPGIYSVNVESQPPNGAMRSATIKIKAWNIDQLSKIDILYFRLGCSMLLEWGHTVFVNNAGGLITNVQGVDIFTGNNDRDHIIQQIAAKRKQYSYNYDAMLGRVVNYEWSVSPDGSYDCIVKLTGLGSVIESLKINTQTAMPPVVTAPTGQTQTQQTQGAAQAQQPATTDPATAPQTNQVAKPVSSNLSLFLDQVEQIPEGSFASEVDKLFSTGLNLLAKPTQAAMYGYSVQYMSAEYGSTKLGPKVDFAKLKTRLQVPTSTLENGQPKAPTPQTYIPLGLLLAYINNSCLLYDTKGPAHAIDFNPETNLCIRLPNQFSTNPGVCYVDLDCSSDEYTNLFKYKDVSTDKITAPAPDTPANSPVIETLRGLQGGSFIAQGTRTRGRIMYIYVNTKCIRDTLTECEDSDKNVPLSKFLDSLIKKIQTALGNINFFEVGYNEDGNVVTVYDAQAVSEEQGAIPELPVFGLKSIAREFSLRTDISTNLQSMLAITARADARNTGTNKDASSFTALNNSIEDRLFPKISDIPGGGDKKENPPDKSGIEQAANTFNLQISKLYNLENAEAVIYDSGDVNTIQQFYIDAMLTAKKGEGATPEPSNVTATGVLPLKLNLTLDGIGGVRMYQAFAISADRLPASFTKNGKPRVAFNVIGLNHSIENNRWITTIVGGMFNLSEKQTTYKAGYTGKPKAAKPRQETTTVVASGDKCSNSAEIKKRGFVPVTSKMKTFAEVMSTIIQNIEGGYYHPDMKAANPKKFAVMLSSGETMYGIDRRAGAKATSDCAACSNAQKTGLWDVIAADKVRNSSSWYYGYAPKIGTPLQKQLYDLAQKVQEPQYDAPFTRYLKAKKYDMEFKKIVESDGRLWFHFIDMWAWNGHGWAQGFTQIAYNAYKNGEKDPYKLHEVLTQEKQNGGYNAYKLGTGDNLGAGSALLITRRGNKYTQFIACE